MRSGYQEDDLVDWVSRPHNHLNIARLQRLGLIKNYQDDKTSINVYNLVI